MVTVKIYKNNSKEDMAITELGLEIPAGEQVSIATEYHTPLNPVNYPGLEDLTDETAEEQADD